MRIFGAVALACAVAGCASYGNESIRNVTSENASQQIVKGKTTKAEVKTALGDPSMVSFTDSGNEQWMYNLSSYTPSVINFIPYVSSVAQAGQGQTKNVVVLFDKAGVVMNYTVASSQQDIRSGIIGQPVR